LKSTDDSLADLLNDFLSNLDIAENDYYLDTADDDGYEPGVFDAIRKMDDPVIFISMKRGFRTPPGLLIEKQYPCNTLIAHPDNVKIGSIGGEQIIMKGSVLKTIRFDKDNEAVCDGILAMELKEKYPIRYEPTLYALFNYFQPGRWDNGLKISFGCMVNDPLRVNMVLQQSEIQGSLHYIQNPESATKGLNKLLDIIEKEGADLGILTHQDMFYRAGWIEQVREQISKLPDSWVVAGIIGKDMKGLVAGQFHDMRIPLHFNTRHVHAFPQPACCFDECTIIVNIKKGFRFDETLDGFDLYGTLCVL
jgi:hypothetical protein